MNVIFISQCEGNALTETRRILDTFACRCGDRVWQTVITQQGLDAVYALLRKTARKNTAVLCRWVHGKNHADILWIVGNKRKFNEFGMVPTNSTEKDILRAADENDWTSLELIRLVTSLASLWHDFGKATEVFQRKLEEQVPRADALRHEWVSLRLLQAFIESQGSTDAGWIGRLAALDEKPLTSKEEKAWLSALQKDGLTACSYAFKTLPPLARIVGWLILSHHRMPVQSWTAGAFTSEAQLRRLPELIDNDWGYTSAKADAKAFKELWKFRNAAGLPHRSQSWRKKTASIAGKLLSRSIPLEEDFERNVFLMHIGRMALMLADHEYSSRTEENERLKGDEALQIYANTNRKKHTLNQKLDEHLLGVEKAASSLLRYLPRLRQDMPSLGMVRAFRKRCAVPRFRWQDKAYDLASELAERSRQQGFFGVNIASTGCGKTFANGRICYALAGGEGARFTIALGLRTLTLQTGDAYREKLGLGAADVAVLAGGTAVRDLYSWTWGEGKKQEEQPDMLEELRDELLPHMAQVSYAGSSQTILGRWLSTRPDATSLLEAPILACTIDHLVGATEGLRGGRQIVPMLRLLTSDLVLDEPDDFDMLDLHALSRLVFWAGMLGSRVILSSATIPEALARGLFEAYRQGRSIFAQNRGAGNTMPVCCAWFDEFGANTSDAGSEEEFAQLHKEFVTGRVRKLEKAAERRRVANILPLDSLNGKRKEDIPAALAASILEAIPALHEANCLTDRASGKRISLGIVRMANIDPLVDTALELLKQGGPKGWHIHLCCYHSHYPLCMRSKIEHDLDKLLQRSMPEEDYLRRAQVQRLFAQSPAQEHVVLVLATSVAEVGRDHDYDWAIVEPSSVRSIVQLAGRVRRHREGRREAVNMSLLSHNVKGLYKPLTDPVFCRPGFESEDFPLATHDLRELLSAEQLERIDASLRVLEREKSDPAHNLADLEQEAMRDLQRGDGTKRTPLSRWWAPHAHLCGEIQRKTPFRKDDKDPQSFAWLPDEYGEFHFHRMDEQGGPIPAGNKYSPMDVPNHLENISFLTHSSLKEVLQELALEFDMDELRCAERYGWVSLPTRGNEQGWYYHDHLGFRSQR
ncbi:type I-F CRISPR-associated helicase Cas3f [Mailhella sp.]